MQDNSSPDLERLLSMTWAQLMKLDHFPAAALVALAGYAAAQEQGNERLREGALAILFKAVDELKAKQRGSSEQPAPVCSFCGRGPSEVRLAVNWLTGVTGKLRAAARNSKPPFTKVSAPMQNTNPIEIASATTGRGERLRRMGFSMSR